jgi:hypothetical protein
MAVGAKHVSKKRGLFLVKSVAHRFILFAERVKLCRPALDHLRSAVPKAVINGTDYWTIAPSFEGVPNQGLPVFRKVPTMGEINDL